MKAVHSQAIVIPGLTRDPGLGWIPHHLAVAFGNLFAVWNDEKLQLEQR